MSKHNSDGEKIARMIEDLLTTIGVADAGWNVPEMGFFDGTIPGIRSLFDENFETFQKWYGTNNGNAFDQALADSKNARGALAMAGDTSNGNKSRFTISGAKELSITEKQVVAPRLAIQFPSSLAPSAYFNRVIESRCVTIDDRGRTKAEDRSYYYLHKGSWRPMKDETIGPDGQGSLGTVGLAAAAWTAGLSAIHWTVRVRIDPSLPSVSIFTDPTGVHEFFKSREVPPGGTRRAALLHWVSQHWRQARRDPDVEVYVREYLRGKREFQWGGMGAEILVPVSTTDRERIAVERRKRLAEEGRTARLRDKLRI